MILRMFVQSRRWSQSLHGLMLATTLKRHHHKHGFCAMTLRSTCSEQVLVQRDSQRGSSKEKRLQNVTRQVGIVEKSYVDGTAKCRQSLQRLVLASNTSSSSSVPVSSAEDGVLDEQISKLWETFQILDTEGLARLTAEDLNNYDKQGSPERRKRFQGLIEEFNSMRVVRAATIVNSLPTWGPSPSMPLWSWCSSQAWRENLVQDP